MARKHKIVRSSGYSILLADDDPDYLEATRRLLESEGHEVVCAKSGAEVLARLAERPMDLLLLDYFMPGMTGEEVVAKLRQFNSTIQVILQTGYASERPPREMLHRLDIQGYYDKSEGPDKLLLWTDAGLKAASVLKRLHRSRSGLHYVLNVTPSMHKIQPLTDLFQSILSQMAGLLGAVNSFLGVRPELAPAKSEDAAPDSFLALMQDDADLVICAQTGHFQPLQKVDACLDPEEAERVGSALQRGEVHVSDAATLVPLRVGELTLGVIYLQAASISAQDIELLKIFANQATSAIQNMQLYEMAALDPLTGVHARRFFEQRLLCEVRGAFRLQQPLSFLMVDMDDLKKINDTAGHLAGDQALSTMGKVLRQVTRENDVVGRYGGDEFVVILPQTRADGAETVGRRIVESLHGKTVVGPGGDLVLGGSVGLSFLPEHGFAPADIPRPVPASYFQKAAQALIQRADEALYQSKKQGRCRLCRAPVLEWERFA